MDLPLLFKALRFAAFKHRNQRRKDVGASPYINHPIAVASVLSEEGGITDVEILCGALLHDTVEDTETTLTELETLFGQTITRYVAEMTDDKNLPKAERKRQQIVSAPHKLAGSKQIKIADKICNVRDVSLNPPANWPMERRVAYLDWTEEVVAGCRGLNTDLEAAYDRSLAEAREQLASETASN